MVQAIILVFFCSASLQGSQQSKLTDEDDKKDISYELSHDSSQQARVAQSLQAHDYVCTLSAVCLYYIADQTSGHVLD